MYTPRSLDEAWARCALWCHSARRRASQTASVCTEPSERRTRWLRPPRPRKRRRGL